MLVFSWQMAEELAAEHMRQLGFEQVRRMPDGVDGGIDVSALNAAGQAKHHAIPVGGPDIQRLRGAAPATEHLLFYSSSGYTPAAFKAAELADVCLFRYTTANVVEAENDAARHLQSRAVQDESASVMTEFLLSWIRVVVYSRWFPKYMTELSPRVNDLSSGRLVVSSEEAETMLVTVKSLMAAAPALDQIRLLLVDVSALEMMNTQNWVALRSFTEKLAQAITAFESHLIIDGKQARRLNQSQARHLKKEMYDFLRTASLAPASFVASERLKPKERA